MKSEYSSIVLLIVCVSCSAMFVFGQNTNSSTLLSLERANGDPASLSSSEALDRWLKIESAVTDNDTNTLRQFVVQGYDVNRQVGDNRSTLLMRGAFFGGHVEVARILLEAGADAMMKDRGGSTAFETAVGQGHRDFAKLLLDKGGAAYTKETFGCGLWVAARGMEKGCEKSALWMLDLGADPNWQPTNSTETVIWRAARTGKEELVRVLLKKGARLEGKGREGGGLLHAAVGLNNTNVVASLINAGCDVNETDPNGRTPLHLLYLGLMFERKDQTTTIDLLINAGADIGKKDKFGATALENMEREVKSTESRKKENTKLSSEAEEYFVGVKAMRDRLLYHSKNQKKAASK